MPASTSSKMSVGVASAARQHGLERQRDARQLAAARRSGRAAAAARPGWGRAGSSTASRRSRRAALVEATDEGGRRKAQLDQPLGHLPRQPLRPPSRARRELAAALARGRAQQSLGVGLAPRALGLQCRATGRPLPVRCAPYSTSAASSSPYLRSSPYSTPSRASICSRVSTTASPICSLAPAQLERHVVDLRLEPGQPLGQRLRAGIEAGAARPTARDARARPIARAATLAAQRLVRLGQQRPRCAGRCRPRRAADLQLVDLAHARARRPRSRRRRARPAPGGARSSAGSVASSLSAASFARSASHCVCDLRRAARRGRRNASSTSRCHAPGAAAAARAGRGSRPADRPLPRGARPSPSRRRCAPRCGPRPTPRARR